MVGRRVLISILTSGKPDLLVLCYESVTKQERGNCANGADGADGAQGPDGAKYTYDVVVVVNSTDPAYADTVRALVPGVEVVVTESNGRPGKGHNSVLTNFRKRCDNHDYYDYCLLVDGDDFLYPRALSRIERYLDYEPDVLLLTFHDKLGRDRSDAYAGVPHFSIDDRAVWFYNLTDVTVPRWYEAKGTCPFGRDVTDLNTAARPLVFSRRALDFDLAYDENMALFDDFVVFCKCLERSVLGDLRVFGVVDSHLYLYNTTSESATSRFFGPIETTGAEERLRAKEAENAQFRLSVRGKFLAIRRWDLRALRLLELGQDDEPDNIVTKYRFVSSIVPRMRLPRTVVPCDNAEVVAKHAMRACPVIAREMEVIRESRNAREKPDAITVCVGESWRVLAHTLDRNAAHFRTWYVIARPDDRATAALLAHAPPNVKSCCGPNDKDQRRCSTGRTVVTIDPGVYLPRNFLGLIPSSQGATATYTASECVYDSLEGFLTATKTVGPSGPAGPTASFKIYVASGTDGPNGTEGPSVEKKLRMTVARLAFETQPPLPAPTLRTLVVVIGSARGGEETWRSMYTGLLVPFNADLAVHLGTRETLETLETTETSVVPSLYRQAKYVWGMPEYANWREYYESLWANGPDGAEGPEGTEGPNGPKGSEGPTGKRAIAAMVENAATGMAGGIDGHPGSGAIICAFRHSLLREHDAVLAEYDRIILTRTDYYYVADHPVLPNDTLYVVEGEDYGGICDRHWVFPSSMRREVLGVVEYMADPEGYTTDKAALECAAPGLVNPETMLALALRKAGVLGRTRRCRRVQFSVHTSNDATRWREATIPFKPEQDLFEKYEGEYTTAMANLRDRE